MAWLLEEQTHTDIIKEIERGSDRSAGIVAAAYLEEQLTVTLRTVLRQDNEIADRMFKGYGALASFYAQIELGYLLGMYRGYMRDAMHNIREIRNRFAHGSGKRTFKTPEIRDRCNNLPGPLWKKGTFYLAPDELKLVLSSHDVSDDKRNMWITMAIYKGRDTPRNRYLIATKAILVHLYLIRVVSQQQRRLCELAPGQYRYWPWPLPDKSEKPKPPAPQSAGRKRKKQRPQRKASGA